MLDNLAHISNNIQYWPSQLKISLYPAHIYCNIDVYSRAEYDWPLNSQIRHQRCRTRITFSSKYLTILHIYCNMKQDMIDLWIIKSAGAFMPRSNLPSWLLSAALAGQYEMRMIVMINRDDTNDARQWFTDKLDIVQRCFHQLDTNHAADFVWTFKLDFP